MPSNNKIDQKKIYLDFLSASPVLPEVLEAMLPFFTEHYGNSSSIHSFGLYARDAIKEARKYIAQLINAETSEQIYFTSDTTEAANWAVKGSAEALKRYGNHIITSEIEHPSILESLSWLEKQGFTITRLKVDSEGNIDINSLKSTITDKTILVAIQIANTDIGTIQSIEEISNIVSEKGIQLYMDADAAVGWMPIDTQKFKPDIMTFSAQRFYGPKGCAILYCSRKARLANLLHGGTQESGKRPGIHNVPAIVGTGKAAQIALNKTNDRISKAKQIQQLLWDKIKNNIPHIKLNGPPISKNRMPNSLNISFEFLEGKGCESLALLCDMQNLLISSGTACVSRGAKPSPTLDAIGLNQSLATSSILLSWGDSITTEEANRAAEILSKNVSRLRSMSNSWESFENGLITAITPKIHP